MYMCIYIYIYICIYREREGGRERDSPRSLAGGPRKYGRALPRRRAQRCWRARQKTPLDPDMDLNSLGASWRNTPFEAVLP